MFIDKIRHFEVLPHGQKTFNPSDLLLQARTDTENLLKEYYEEEFLPVSQELFPDARVGDPGLEQYYMQKASAWYVVTYRSDHVHWPRQGPRGQTRYPLLSFAWVALPYITKIKRESRLRRATTASVGRLAQRAGTLDLNI